MDEHQARVIKKIEQGRNVFFTGPAGVGKSFVIAEAVKFLKYKYGEEYDRKVCVTAMTAIAASLIGGTTLHSALGIGVPNFTHDIANKLAAKKRLSGKASIRNLEVLVVDECGMMSGEMMYLLFRDLKKILERDVQFIFCGDFFQLSPIATKRRPDGKEHPPEAFMNFGLAFETEAWRKCFAPEDCVVLKNVYRQEDKEFIELLNRIRVGDRAMEAMHELIDEQKKRSKALPDVQNAHTDKEVIKSTLIFSRNKDIDVINDTELNKLEGTKRTYHAQDSHSIDPKIEANSVVRDTYKTLLEKSDFYRSCQAPSALSLKVGAQVMLVKNPLDPDTQLCNGSRGVVVGFKYDYETLQTYPEVRFLNGEVRVIKATAFESEFSGMGKCTRIQIPLKLAWAITVHKSQGMSLDLVDLSLEGVFASGQGYVGLSRARSRSGLTVVDWDGSVVPVDARVKAFYESLERGEAPARSKRFDMFAEKRNWVDRCMISDD